MTVATWPAELPQALDQSGFNESVADNLLESQPDIGPPITRKRGTSAGRPLSGNLTLTAAQLATFREFFEEHLSDGALPFNFPDQVRAGTLLVKFAKGSLPSWGAISGDLYRLSISLTVLP